MSAETISLILETKSPVINLLTDVILRTRKNSHIRVVVDQHTFLNTLSRYDVQLALINPALLGITLSELKELLDQQTVKPAVFILNSNSKTAAPVDEIKRYGWQVISFSGRGTSQIEIDRAVQDALAASTDRPGQADSRMVRLHTLAEIDKAMLRAQSPESIAQTLIDHLQDLLPAAGGSVALFEEENNRLRVLAATESGSDLLNTSSVIPLSEYSPYKILKRQQLAYTRDLRTLKKTTLADRELMSRGVRSHLALPLMSDDQLFGSLNLVATLPSAFDEESLQIALEVADRLALVLQQAEMRKEIEQYTRQLEKIVEERTARISENEQRIRAQFDSIPVPTYIWKFVDNDFELIDFNDAAMAITQGKVGGLAGIRASKLHAEMPEIIQALHQAYENRTTLETEMEYQFKTTGETRHLIVKYSYCPPDSIIVHTDDITRFKEAEQRVSALERLYVDKERELRALRAKTDFLSDALPQSLQQLLADFSSPRLPADVSRRLKLLALNARMFLNPEPNHEIIASVRVSDILHRILKARENLPRQANTKIVLEEPLPEIAARHELLHSFLDLWIEVLLIWTEQQPPPAIHISGHQQDDRTQLVFNLPPLDNTFHPGTIFQDYFNSLSAPLSSDDLYNGSAAVKYFSDLLSCRIGFGQNADHTVSIRLDFPGFHSSKTNSIHSRES